jgi:sirohydrochlorin ferrochelatase
MTGPVGGPAALDKVRKLGAERVLVAPYFLFAGVLPDRVAAQAGEFAILAANAAPSPRRPAGSRSRPRAAPLTRPCEKNK